MRPQLRLFTGDDASNVLETRQVPVQLNDICRLLTDAINGNRAWLSDFQDDEVLVSEDLYEIITAYSRLRPSA